MTSPSSRFTATPGAWDITLARDADDTNPLTLMLVQDDEVALWEGADAPALVTDQAVYRETAVMWQPFDGCGHSRRSPETTGAGPDGQIVSRGTSFGRNATFVVPGIVMPAGKLTPVDLPPTVTSIGGRILDGEEYGPYPITTDERDLYITTRGRYLLRVAAGTDAVTAIDLGASYTTDSLQTFDGKLYVSSGGNGVVRELDETLPFVACGANCEATFMGRVNWIPSNAIMGLSGGGVPADHLILVDEAGDGFYHVVSGNDVKLFANWIGSGGGVSIPIGDSTFKITSCQASSKVVWFPKSNGVHGITETGRVVNLTPWVERTFHPDNGRASAFFSDDERAFLFYGHEQGLVAVNLNGTQQERAQWIQFGGKMPNETPIFGRPRAIAPYVDGVFVAYYDGTNSYVMRLIFEQGGGWRWSGSECTIAGEEITWMRVTTRNHVPRLWIGTVINPGASIRLYWQALPASGNPWVDYEQDLGHLFSTDWDVTVPRDDAGSSAEKVVRRYDLVARGAQDDNVIYIDASADDGAYVEQGQMTDGRRVSMVATTYQTGAWFKWRLRCTNAEDVPIVLETFQARMSVLPEQVDVWTFRCQLAAGQGIGNDNEDLQDPWTVKQRIRALQRSGPIHLRQSPLSRETMVVKLEQGARIQTVWSRATRSHIVVLTLTVSILSSGGLFGVDVFGGSEFGEE